MSVGGDVVSCVVVSVIYIFLPFFGGLKKMVQFMKEAVADYEDRFRKMQCLPRFSYGRGMVRKDGSPNRIFLTYPFGHQELAIQFLKAVDLIRGKVQCNICERDMTWSAESHRSDGFR